MLRPDAEFAVARGVEGFRSVMVNYYFVQATTPSSGWVLVDAGLRVSGPRLKREAARRFGWDTPPLAVILTHAHFDHVGALPMLLREWNVPVYAHAEELPFLERQTAYPPPDPRVGGGLMALSSPLYPRAVPPLDASIQALPVDGSVPFLPDWKWIPTPGHSPGHVALWRERDRLLIAGDAVITTRQESALAVLTQRREIRPPPAYFTPDWRSAFESVLRVRALAPSLLASGHGLPMDGTELADGLDHLVANFATEGLPRQGRYVPGAWREA